MNGFEIKLWYMHTFYISVQSTVKFENETNEDEFKNGTMYDFTVTKTYLVVNFFKSSMPLYLEKKVKFNCWNSWTSKSQTMYICTVRKILHYYISYKENFQIFVSLRSLPIYMALLHLNYETW